MKAKGLEVEKNTVWAVYLKGPDYSNRAICTIGDLSDYNNKLRMWLVNNYEIAFPKLEKAIASYDDFVRIVNREKVKLELVKIEVL